MYPSDVQTALSFHLLRSVIVDERHERCKCGILEIKLVYGFGIIAFVVRKNISIPNTAAAHIRKRTLEIHFCDKLVYLRVRGSAYFIVFSTDSPIISGRFEAYLSHQRMRVS